MGAGILEPGRNRSPVDVRVLGRCRVDGQSIPPRAPRHGRSRPHWCRAVGELHLGARDLDVESEPLRLASGLLDDRAAELDVGARPVPLVTAGLCLRRRILRLLGCPPRRALRAGVLQSKRLLAAGLHVLAGDGDQHGGVRQPALPAAELQPLLLRGLLRLELLQWRVLPVVLVQLRRVRLRSVLRPAALAESAEHHMGADRPDRLPKSCRQRGRAAAAHFGGAAGADQERCRIKRQGTAGCRATRPTGEGQRHRVATPAGDQGRAGDTREACPGCSSVPRDTSKAGDPRGGDAG